MVGKGLALCKPPAFKLCGQVGVIRLSCHGPAQVGPAQTSPRPLRPSPTPRPSPHYSVFLCFCAQARPGSICVFVPTEITSYCFYPGLEKNRMVSNIIFRWAVRRYTDRQYAARCTGAASFPIPPLLLEPLEKLHLFCRLRGAAIILLSCASL